MCSNIEWFLQKCGFPLNAVIVHGGVTSFPRASLHGNMGINILGAIPRGF